MKAYAPTSCTGQSFVPPVTEDAQTIITLPGTTNSVPGAGYGNGAAVEDAGGDLGAGGSGFSVATGDSGGPLSVASGVPTVPWNAGSLFDGSVSIVGETNKRSQWWDISGVTPSLPPFAVQDARGMTLAAGPLSVVVNTLKEYVFGAEDKPGALGDVMKGLASKSPEALASFNASLAGAVPGDGGLQQAILDFALPEAGMTEGVSVDVSRAAAIGLGNSGTATLSVENSQSSGLILALQVVFSIFSDGGLAASFGGASTDKSYSGADGTLAGAGASASMKFTIDGKGTSGSISMSEVLGSIGLGGTLGILQSLGDESGATDRLVAFLAAQSEKLAEKQWDLAVSVSAGGEWSFEAMLRDEITGTITSAMVDEAEASPVMQAGTVTGSGQNNLLGLIQFATSLGFSVKSTSSRNDPGRLEIKGSASSVAAMLKNSSVLGLCPELADWAGPLNERAADGSTDVKLNWIENPKTGEMDFAGLSFVKTLNEGLHTDSDGVGLVYDPQFSQTTTHQGFPASGVWQTLQKDPRIAFDLERGIQPLNVDIPLKKLLKADGATGSQSVSINAELARVQSGGQLGMFQRLAPDFPDWGSLASDRQSFGVVSSESGQDISVTLSVDRAAIVQHAGEKSLRLGRLGGEAGVDSALSDILSEAISFAQDALLNGAVGEPAGALARWGFSAAEALAMVRVTTLEIKSAEQAAAGANSEMTAGVKLKGSGSAKITIYNTFTSANQGKTLDQILLV